MHPNAINPSYEFLFSLIMNGISNEPGDLIILYCIEISLSNKSSLLLSKYSVDPLINPWATFS